MTEAQKLNVELREARRNADYCRGRVSGGNPFFLLVQAGHSVLIDDDEMTGNSHRHRWLVVDGDHIGRRSTWTGLEKLARKALVSRDLAALKRAEMDREDREARRGR